MPQRTPTGRKPRQIVVAAAALLLLVAAAVTIAATRSGNPSPPAVEVAAAHSATTSTSLGLTPDTVVPLAERRVVSALGPMPPADEIPVAFPADGLGRDDWPYVGWSRRRDVLFVTVWGNGCAAVAYSYAVLGDQRLQVWAGTDVYPRPSPCLMSRTPRTAEIPAQRGVDPQQQLTVWIDGARMTIAPR